MFEETLIETENTTQQPKPTKKQYKKKFPNGRDIKAYNKLYYEKHETHILCNLCNCPVIQHGLLAHQKTKRCKNIHTKNQK